MKKALLAVFLAGTAYGAAGVQQSINQLGQTGNWVLAFNWTADGGGLVPSTAAKLQGCCNGYFITQVETVPGSPSPTNGYGVQITDSAGVDALGGAAAAVSASIPQAWAAAATATPIQGNFNLVLTGNSVASASGIVYVFLQKPGTVNLAKINGGGGGGTTSANWLTLSNPPFVDARIYNWTPQRPGGSLAAGSRTISLSPMPAGINSTSVGTAWVYISSGVGTAEAVPITAWTTSTITVTVANSHTGSWQVGPGNTGAQEAALASPVGAMIYLIAGQYQWHTPLYLPTQVSSGISGTGLVTSLFGAGRESSQIAIASDFPVAQPTIQSSGYIQNTQIEPGPDVENLTLVFPQPDSTNLNLYTHWTGFGFANSPRFKIANVTAVAAWIGINALGNTGGSVLDHYWDSSFNTGWEYNGSLGKVVMYDYEHWPFGLTTNQSTLFQFNTAIWAGQSGRSDLLEIVGGLTESGNGLHFYLDGDGNGTNAFISGFDFDTTGGLAVDGGKIQLTNCLLTVGPINASMLTQTNGNVIITGSLLQGVSETAPMVLIQPGMSVNGYISTILTSNTIQAQSIPTDTASLITVTATSGTALNLNVSNNYFILPPNISFSNPRIVVTPGSGAARVTITGNEGIDAGTGVSQWLSNASTGFNAIYGNDFPGWGFSLPNGCVTGIVENNGLSYCPISQIGAPNIVTDTGATNAIAGSLTGLTLTTGVQVIVNLNNTLQAGANTFNLNSGGPVAIKSHRNSASNIGTGYAAGVPITLYYNGTAWLDMSQ